MSQAIDAAWTARRLVSPRPWVGAVVVPAGEPDHDGFIGTTQGRLGPHAEVMALRAAGDRARGATVYTTLEPCFHTGRTGPCAEALVEAGVARVVVGLVDPDPQVAGQGIEQLRAAGIAVDVGPGEVEIAAQLAPYLHHRRTGRPLVVLKLAATLDGRTAAPDGTSQWITGPEARADAHRLRADSDAVLVGAGTVRLDDPALTVRLADEELPPGFEQPRRVVLGRVPDGAAVSPALELNGPLDEVLDELGDKGVLQVLVEGGARVAHAFHTAGLVDRYVIYLAPALFGGDDARGLFAGPGASTITDLWRGTITAVTALGRDVRLDLAAERPTGAPTTPASTSTTSGALLPESATSGA
jgi:diaminohydroxyphosphoribosylaminopyrimidine deaminase/5-amino-6-(5-phosphoribosylamino)uracil reductase